MTLAFFYSNQWRRWVRAFKGHIKSNTIVFYDN